MLAVVGVVAGFEIQAKASGVHAALESVLSSPTLQIVATAQVPKASENATVSQYSVVLSVTSKNSSAPISAGSDNVGAFEISVLRRGEDLVDVVSTGSATYARVNLTAISRSDYESSLRSLASSHLTGMARVIASAVVHDEWVGITESTVRTFESELGAVGSGQLSQMPSASEISALRNALTMSFSQSWDTWVSIHQLSSSNGTTEYSLTLPVQHFVASLLADLKSSIVKDLPTTEGAAVARELGTIESSVNQIPSSLEIPMTMWVTDGSLSRLQVSYEGYAVNLAFSHPTVGVTAPKGASMISAATLKTLFDDMLGCASSGTFGSSGATTSCGTGIPGVSGVSGLSGIASSVGSLGTAASSSSSVSSGAAA